MPASLTSTTRSPLTPRAVFAGAICVMAAAVLIAARQPFQQSDVASVSAPPKAMPLPEEIALPKPVASPIAVAPSAVTASMDPAAPRLESKKNVPPKPVTVAVARPSDASAEKTASAESVKAMAAEPAAHAPKADATTTHTAAVESASNAASQTATAVTITGCVANDEETFWLKDTSGADAPKARNWKSGFLKKRPAPIALLDSTHALKLPNYVGQRVAATGTLVNREMRAHSLQRVATSCS